MTSAPFSYRIDKLKVFGQTDRQTDGVCPEGQTNRLRLYRLLLNKKGTNYVNLSDLIFHVFEYSSSIMQVVQNFLSNHEKS